MLLSPALVAGISLGFLLFLFGAAYWAEKRKDRGRSIISNPVVYSLSIAVYCTSWTFYGSVGRATVTGFGFLAIYLGPTLIAFSWWALLRKMVRISHENHITSISDFVASRYGKSGRVGALVALISIIGVSPYIALQLKAVSASFEILTRQGPLAFPGAWLVGNRPLYLDTGLIAALALGVFGGMFGARSIDPSERHEGLVAAVALESVVQLLALTAVGVFVTWSVFGGLRDIFGQIAADPAYSHLLTFGHSTEETYAAWFALLALSTGSVMLLPRQFHIMVVENCEEEHIRRAMWGFPLYLFLVNLFVVPIAFGGLLLLDGQAPADTFVLTVPMSEGAPALALVAFVGGLCAATSMVLVSSVTLATMFLNNLAMPVFVRVGWPRNFAPYLIHLKRAAIIGVVLLGYFYQWLLGQRFMLVDIGLISFGAAVQLGPAVIGGMYWRQATSRGAAAGLLCGFAAWAYMFLTPALCAAGWFPVTLVEQGPWGLSLLRPTAFLGLDGLDVWSHGLFWSFLMNTGAFFAVSLLTEPSPGEVEQIPKFVDALGRPESRRPEFRLARPPSVGEFQGLLAKFIGSKAAKEKIAAFYRDRPEDAESLPSDDTVRDLRGYVENTLAGVVGPVAASMIVERYLNLKGTTLEEIFDVFGAVSISLEESREELESRVRELAVLFEASKRVAATLEERKAIEAVLDLIGADLGLDCQAVFLLDNGVLSASVARGFSPPYLEGVAGNIDSQSYVGQAALTRCTAYLSDWEGAGSRPSLDFEKNPMLRSVIATPIVQENQTLGVLVAGTTRRKGHFSEKFVEAFEVLASELALAISNARLYAEVRELNRTLEVKVADRTRELEAANRNLQELDRLKSEFLANMSHELRTPLNSILGYTQLVLDGVDGPISEDQHKSLERVEANASHLLKLINDILDLSKIEAGHVELDYQPLDLGELTREVVEDQRSLARPKGLSCEVRISGEDLRVEADGGKIREVLYNLVNNAIKFTDRGGISVRVLPAPRDDRDGVEVQVEDTGVGIPKTSFDDLFKAFKQLDGSTTRAHGGTGLGLSIAKRIVELHEGTIRVESQVGKGSCFAVWLPRKPTIEGRAS